MKRCIIFSFVFVLALSNLVNFLPQTVYGAGENSSVITIQNQDRGSDLFEVNFKGSGWGHSSDSWNNNTEGHFEFEFLGDQFRLIGAKAPGHGIASISIDGGPEQKADLYAPSRQSGVYYESPKLEAGKHKVKVSVTGEKNTAANNTYIVIDNIEVDVPSDISLIQLAQSDVQHAGFVQDETNTPIMLRLTNLFSDFVPKSMNINFDNNILKVSDVTSAQKELQARTTEVSKNEVTVNFKVENPLKQQKTVNLANINVKAEGKVGSTGSMKITDLVLADSQGRETVIPEVKVDIPIIPKSPQASVPSGRYEETKKVTLNTTTKGAEIYYTLDGTMPTKKSTKYKKNKPIVISKTTNISAIAVKKGVSSKPVTFTYIIKTKEKPLLKFVAMSDVHIGSRESADPRYVSFFDTISSIFPNPDAIFSVGDMINDNGFDKPDDHKMVKEVFLENLERKNMTNTKIHLAIGNHDASVAKMQEHYPAEWFTSHPNGYYETQVGGYYFFTLNGNNYNSDIIQRNWLKGRLAEITSDPKNKNKPIFVNVHQPISGTVMDGQQSSNKNLYTDLKDFPQVITLSGHSHLNINDDRSIYQKDFTSVNLGSMSYIESDPGYLAVTKDGLVNQNLFSGVQAQFIEVYKDRMEFERIALNADHPEMNQNPPFFNTGVSVGEKWVVKLAGNTNEEIKSNFAYTPEKRSKVAPQFQKKAKISIKYSDRVPNLTFPQAKDDQTLHHYEIKVSNHATGDEVKTLKVFSDYFFAPIPDAMNIPLEGLEQKTEYNVEVTAVDCFGNKSTPIQKKFETR